MKKEFRLEHLGFCGILSLLSYAAMVFISPVAYPGYDWLSMAVSDLSAVGASSADFADRLNALFGPCGLVSIMAVCVAVSYRDGKLFKIGIGLLPLYVLSLGQEQTDLDPLAIGRLFA